MQTLTPDEWKNKYKPTLGSHESMFLTGVPTNDTQHVWSLINRYGDKFIVPGVVHNAIAFAVTEKPYTENEIVYYTVN